MSLGGAIFGRQRACFLLQEGLGVVLVTRYLSVAGKDCYSHDKKYIVGAPLLSAGLKFSVGDRKVLN